METKICMQCGKEKPVSDFNLNAAKYDGIDSYCKSCRTENRIKYKQNKSKKMETPKRKRRTFSELTRVYDIIRREFGDTKVCEVCGQEKKIEAYTICVTGKDGLRNACKDCIHDLKDKGLKLADAKIYKPITKPVKKKEDEFHSELKMRQQEEYSMAPIIITKSQQEPPMIVTPITEGELYGVYDLNGNIKGTLYRNPADAFKEASRLNNECGEMKYFSNTIKIK